MLPAEAVITLPFKICKLEASDAATHVFLQQAEADALPQILKVAKLTGCKGGKLIGRFSFELREPSCHHYIVFALLSANCIFKNF